MKNTLIITFVLFWLNSLSYGFLCSNDGIFVDPENQQTYFQCASGIAYLMSCPSGLFWNQINLVCEIPSVQVPKRFLINVGGDRTTGKCFDVADGNGAIHSLIQLFRCHGEENQQFEFHHDGTIRSMGKCLDIPDSRAVDHQVIQLFNCHPGDENQRFIMDHENRIHVMGKCLDVPNGEIVNNNPLQLFQCRNQGNQQFTLIPV